MKKRPLYDPILVDESTPSRSRNSRAVDTARRPLVGNRTPSNGRHKHRTAPKNAANNNAGSASAAKAAAGLPTNPSLISENSGNHRRSSQILVKLADACHNHQQETHPSINIHRDGLVRTRDASVDSEANENDLPVSCRSALSKLRQLVPKLHREIPPFVPQNLQCKGYNNNDDTLQRATLEDVLQLCNFYQSVLSGCYCPHLPRLFDWGRNVDSRKFVWSEAEFINSPYVLFIYSKIVMCLHFIGFRGGHEKVLDILLYLLRHTFNPAIFEGTFATINEQKSAKVNPNHPYESNQLQGDEKATSESTRINSLDQMISTMAQFLAFLVDEAGYQLQRAVCVDLIHALDDCSVLMLQQQQQLLSKQNQLIFPIKLLLFEETIQVARQRLCESSVEQSRTTDYFVELHDWDKVYVFQTVVLRLLNVSLPLLASVRQLEVSSPSPPSTNFHTMLPSGAIDLVYPPDMVNDGRIVQALARGLKTVLLCIPTMVPSSKAVLQILRKDTAASLLESLHYDWLKVVDVSFESTLHIGILVALAAKNCLLAPIESLSSGMVSNWNHERLLGILLLQLVCKNKVETYSQTHNYVLQGRVLPVLLDGLRGVTAKMVAGGWSFPSFTLHLCFLKTIHFIVESNEQMALAATDYCVSQGLFGVLVTLLCRYPNIRTHSDKVRTDHICYWTVEILRCLVLSQVNLSNVSNWSNLENEVNQSLRRYFASAQLSFANASENPSVETISSNLRTGVSESDERRNVVQPGNPAHDKQHKYQCTFPDDAFFDELPSSWCHAICNVVDKALSSGSVLSGVASFSVGEEELAICHLHTVTTCLHMLIRLDPPNNEGEIPIMTVIEELAYQVLEFCNRHCCNELRPGGKMRFWDLLATETIIKLGFAIQFSSIQKDESNLSKLLHFVSERCQQLCEQDNNIPNEHSIQCCYSQGIPQYFSSMKPSNMSRTSDAFEEFDVMQCHISSSERSFENACEMIHQLPLATKAAIMCSIPFTGASQIEFRFLKLSQKLLSPHCGQPTTESKANISLQVSAVQLHLLPLLCSAIWNEIEDGNEVSTIKKELLSQLRTLLILVAESVEKLHDWIACAFLAALRRLPQTRNDAIVFFDPREVLSFLAFTHKSIRSRFVGRDATMIWRDIASLFVNKKCLRAKNPITRYLFWMTAGDYCASSSPSQLRSVVVDHEDSPHGPNVVSWMMEATYHDRSSYVQQMSRRELASLLASSEHKAVMACFFSNSEFQEYSLHNRNNPGHESPGVPSEFSDAATQAVARMFNATDKLLRDSCGFSETQLSLTIGNSRNSMSPEPALSVSTRLLSLDITCVFYASVCYSADLADPIGIALFEKALLRLIRLSSAASFDPLLMEEFPTHKSTSCCRVLSCVAQSALADSLDLLICFSGRLLWTYLPGALFTDPLILHAKWSRIKKYAMLENIMHLLQASTCDAFRMKARVSQFQAILIQNLPLVAAQFLLEEDEECLRLMIGFLGFLRGRKKSLIASCGDLLKIVGSARPSSLCVSASATVENLDRALKAFCLQKIEFILPTILRRSKPSSLKFLSKILGGLKLGGIISGREQIILKSIIWELGLHSKRSTEAIYALKTAALARSELNPSASEKENNQIGLMAAKDWVTEKFMYLFVNTVQMNWRSRSPEEKIHTLRRLHELFGFLHANKAAQYFPQVLATLNGAINDGCATKDDEPGSATIKKAICLHAVKALSKYVRLVSEETLEVVISNLTDVVVSIIPVIDDFDTKVEVLEETRDEAVSLLEFLADENNIARFPGAFLEIPFIPFSSSLANVHNSLRQQGIVFDNLRLLTTTSTVESQQQQSDGLDCSVGSTKSSKSGDSSSALLKRLRLICDLLQNENNSVKCVALRHLIGLLRSNRALFHGLVMSDGKMCSEDFLTVSFAGKRKHGVISDMIEKLLRRCICETNSTIRMLLSICLGEIGAIAEHNLEDMTLYGIRDDNMTLHRWRLRMPPWQTQLLKYELQLVTKLLVPALRAATSMEEQMKISYAIQQLLVLLDASSQAQGSEESDGSRQGKMSRWLHDQLRKANVFDSVETLWSSEFSIKAEQHHRVRRPPFFTSSLTYPTWISLFCRWMIFEAKQCGLSLWKDFFYACRTAVKSSAGLETAEFILPLIVADRICFGSHHEFDRICREFEMVMDFSHDSNPSMPLNDRQKCVSTVFQVMDTLEFWAEQEKEERCSSLRTTSSSSSRSNRRNPTLENGIESVWPADQTAVQIELLAERIPLLLQAKAASHVGMHARALRLVEMLARMSVVHEFFESDNKVGSRDVKLPSLQQSLMNSLEIKLAEKILPSLNDFETADALNDSYSQVNALLEVEGIRARIARGDVESAFRDYERTIETRLRDSNHENEALECLVQLGRFEALFSRVEYQMIRGDNSAKSFAVEAAWRLGRWDCLSDLLHSFEGPGVFVSSDDLYRTSIGSTLLSLHGKKHDEAASFLRIAREGVLDHLSSVASESYAKSYGDLVRLHETREIEDAALFFSQHHEHDRTSPMNYISESTDHEGWAWNGRSSLMTSRASISVLQTRLGLAQLAGNVSMQSSLLLQIGKQARKNGLPAVSESYLCKAESSLFAAPQEGNSHVLHLYTMLDQIKMQFAKLKRDAGENSVAFRILGQDLMELAMNEIRQTEQHVNAGIICKKTATKYEKEWIERTIGSIAGIDGLEDIFADRFARRLLQLTEWTVDGGMQDGAVLERYDVVINLSPKWEKGHFCFAQYLNNLVSHVLEKEASRESCEEFAIFNAFRRDNSCQVYLLKALQNYADCLVRNAKHLYQALPRMLSLWFDIASARVPDDQKTFKSDTNDLFFSAQNAANTLMATSLKRIPPSAFYTAIPQLVSHLFDESHETTSVLKKILDRVLYKFPEQSMWHLAWLTGSKKKDRSNVGVEIFKEAERVLEKTRNPEMAALLRESEYLFEFFRELARDRSEKTASRHMEIKPLNRVVRLHRFVPPVQQALSVVPYKQTNRTSTEYFPRNIPRMRAFAQKASVMTSKARPKRLTAFAVPSTWKQNNSSATNRLTTRTADDIGEFHFLVKQEAKGDLRKDARVQDWNGVVNRLVDSSIQSQSSLASRSPRLRLRTFAVTCLSEDTGILEWVPNTDSLRGLVSNSYNPQTLPLAPKRRGVRLTQFGDSKLRSDYDACQARFFKKGDLETATKEYYERCVRPYPPLLSWWFVHRFNVDAHAWYEARLRFILSAAAWSAVGHVIGLGDRHSENILVETTTGRLLHVDFDCIFDKGLNLPLPEVVPFRLTPNMVDAFGPTGTNGMFKRGMETILEVLRQNKDLLLSVLEPFIRDPVIDWRRHRSQQNSHDHSQGSVHQAKRSISITRERLLGMYNLRNPNLKKYRKVLARSGRSLIQEEAMMEILPLSTEGQVQKLCLEATKNENLLQLYIGWMPWV